MYESQGVEIREAMTSAKPRDKLHDGRTAQGRLRCRLQNAKFRRSEMNQVDSQDKEDYSHMIQGQGKLQEAFNEILRVPQSESGAKDIHVKWV